MMLAPPVLPTLAKPGSSAGAVVLAFPPALTTARATSPGQIAARIKAPKSEFPSRRFARTGSGLGLKSAALGFKLTACHHRQCTNDFPRSSGRMDGVKTGNGREHAMPVSDHIRLR